MWLYLCKVSVFISESKHIIISVVLFNTNLLRLRRCFFFVSYLFIENVTNGHRQLVESSGIATNAIEF